MGERKNTNLRIDVDVKMEFAKNCNRLGHSQQLVMEVLMEMFNDTQRKFKHALREYEKREKARKRLDKVQKENARKVQ